MVKQGDAVAADKARNQITLTLSAKFMEEAELVAQMKGLPLATHLRNILETHHETPAYGNLVKRAKAWERGETYEGNYKG